MTAWPASCVYLVTDRRRFAPSARTTADEIRALDALVDDAVEAGVSAIQLRERDLDAGALCRIAARVVSRARGTAVRVLVNDRADVAAAAGAAGVHLPGDGIPVQAGRRIDPNWIVGRSVHADDPADRWAGADYVLFGAVFATASKPAGWIPAGLGALAGLVRSTPVPVIAIGGITEANAEEAGAAGAAGVAAIGAFVAARAAGGPGVRHVVRALTEALARGRARRA